MIKDNVVLRFLNKMTDMFVLNILFLICSIPIITIGASLTAMYAVNLRSVRYGDGYIIKTFFKSFRQSFKQATLAWILFLCMALLLYFDYRFWQQVDFGSISNVMKIVSLTFIIIASMIFQWLFPVIAKMKDSFGKQVKNAAAMAVGYFVPYTVICMAITYGALYFVYSNFAAMIVMLMIGFSVVTYVQSFFFYKVFSKFIDETPASDDDLLYSEKYRKNEFEKDIDDTDKGNNNVE